MQYCSAAGQAIFPSVTEEQSADEVSRSFVAAVPSKLSALAQCVCGHDWHQMGKIAAELTQESANRGFPPISRLALQLELACRTDPDEAGILTALEQLDTALRRVRCE